MHSQPEDQNRSFGDLSSPKARNRKCPKVILTKICCEGADNLRNNNRVLKTLPNFAEKNGIIRFDTAKPVVGFFEEDEPGSPGKHAAILNKSYRKQTGVDKD